MSASTTPAEIESPKRQDIICAAGDLFMQSGYGDTSVDAIARAAGVSKATLYAHFPSKEALFATIIHEACRTHLAVTSVLPEQVADLRTALCAMGCDLLRFLLQERALAIHRVVTAECHRFPELGRAFYDNGPGLFRHALTAWLQRQQAAERLHPGDMAVAADQFVGLLRSGLYLRASLGLATPTEAEIAGAVQAAVETFLRAFAPPD